MKNRESKNRESNIDLFDIFRPLIKLKSSKCSHPPGKNAQFYPVIITTSVPKADLISAYHFLHYTGLLIEICTCFWGFSQRRGEPGWDGGALNAPWQLNTTINTSET